VLQTPALHRNGLRAGLLRRESRAEGKSGGEGKSGSHRTLSMKTRKSCLLLDLAVRCLIQGTAGKNGKGPNLQGYLLKPAVRGKWKSFAGLGRNYERPEVLEQETSCAATRSGCHHVTGSR